MPPVYLITDLSHEEGMIHRTKTDRPVERCNKVSCDDIRLRPFGSGGLIRVRERYHSLIDWETSDRYPGDLGFGPLKEGQGERVMQIEIHGLEGCPYVRGDALHKISLLPEGLLQDLLCGLKVLACHPSHDGHQSSPALHLLLQTPILRRLHPNKSSKVTTPHYKLQAVPTEEDLCLQDITEKELLSIVETLKEFKTILFG